MGTGPELDEVRIKMPGVLWQDREKGPTERGTPNAEHRRHAGADDESTNAFAVGWNTAHNGFRVRRTDGQCRPCMAQQGLTMLPCAFLTKLAHLTFQLADRSRLVIDLRLQRLHAGRK